MRAAWPAPVRSRRHGPCGLDPDLYDLENADDPAFDLGFWTALVRERAPRRVLELGLRTGRLTLPLARLGVGRESWRSTTARRSSGRLRARLAESSRATR